MNEADTCRTYVLPKLVDAGWDAPPHSLTEQRTFTDGRIIPVGTSVRRGKQKRADYLLRYTRDFPIAVVEAKADYKSPADGMQQAKEYADILGLKFAYATNGPRSRRRPLGLDDGPRQSSVQHCYGLQQESDLAILRHTFSP